MLKKHVDDAKEMVHSRVEELTNAYNVKEGKIRA